MSTFNPQQRLLLSIPIETLEILLIIAPNLFKRIYKLRTGLERIFSRLLTLCMQNPSVKGLNATANHCTIAYITVLLVALTAVRTGNKDKIRFIKSFLPNI